MLDLPVYALVLTVLSGGDYGNLQQVVPGSPMTRAECQSTLQQVTKPGRVPKGASYECVVAYAGWR